MTHPVLVLPIPSTPSDGDLALRALEGDSFGVELIFRRHAGYLLGLTTRLLANRTAAEAVVAATFVVALRQLPVLQPTASLRGWLARRAVVQSRRRLRRAWWFRWLRRDLQDDDAALGRLARLDLDLDERASLARVDDVLAHARPERRVAWMLSRVEGFELDDIAAACECSPATAWRRIADVDVLIDDPVSGISEAS
jgi:DNA-directed RNA polymerase specialized sigma24 family protein